MANSIKNNVIFVDTTGIVYTGQARVVAIKVKTAAAVGRAECYDNTSAAGQKFADIGDVPINNFDGLVLKADIDTAIFVTITGAGVVAYIYLD